MGEVPSPDTDGRDLRIDRPLTRAFEKRYDLHQAEAGGEIPLLVDAWAFPLIVIGMNSIAAYCMDHLFEDFIRTNLKTNLGDTVFELFGSAYQSLLLGAAVLVVYWLLLFWMYRRKLFLRI